MAFVKAVAFFKALLTLTAETEAADDEEEEEAVGKAKAVFEEAGITTLAAKALLQAAKLIISSL